MFYMMKTKSHYFFQKLYILILIQQMKQRKNLIFILNYIENNLQIPFIPPILIIYKYYTLFIFFSKKKIMRSGFLPNPRKGVAEDSDPYNYFFNFFIQLIILLNIFCKIFSSFTSINCIFSFSIGF